MATPTSSEKIEVGFGAKFDELLAGFSRLENEIGRFATATENKLKSLDLSFGSLTGAVDKVKTAFAALLGALGGGAMFSTVIAHTQQFVIEADKLARTLGIVTQEAVVLKLALGTVGATTEEYLGIATRLTLAVRNNEERFAALGVKTRDANGRYLDGAKMIENVVSALNQYKEGTDRNLAATELTGRSFGQLTEILRLNKEVIDEARKSAAELGLVLGRDDVEAARNYQRAMSDVHDVIIGMQLAITREMLPRLTEMAHWFREVGPEAIKITTASFHALDAVRVVLMNGFKILFEVMARGLKEMQIQFSGLVEMSEIWLTRMPLMDKLKQIGSVGRRMGDESKAATEAMFAAMVASSQEAANKLSVILRKVSGEYVTIADAIRRFRYMEKDLSPAAGGGDKAYPGPKQPMLPKLEADLAQLKAHEEHKSSLEGSYQRFSLEQEREYWAKYVNSSKLSREERLAVQIKYWNLETEIARRNFTAEIATLKANEAEFKRNLEAKLAISQDIQARMGRAFGEKSPEAEAARKNTESILREIADRNRRIEDAEIQHRATLSEKILEADRSVLDMEFNLLRVSKQQQLQVEQAFEERRYAVQLQALRDRLALAEQDPDRNIEAIKSLHRDIEGAEAEHQNRILEIRKAVAIESAKYAVEGQRAVQSEFASLIDQMSTNFRNLGKVLLNFANQIAAALQRIASQKIAEQVFGGGSFGGSIVASIMGSIFGGPGAGAAAGASASSALGSGLRLPAGFKFGGSYATGLDYVPRDMLVQVHKGEKISAPGAGLEGVTIINHFHVPAPASTRSQQQVAYMAGSGIRRALARQG